ncbi:MAG: hypothetical protein F6J90_17895 [Moorea sp. SIOASIH]|uniref:hypothetical protein n=1 Tax=Moorena sp. SIOASIH TaxID=2607817 RepID=UPI0013BCF7BA|nr:hypothetical protein [Moorena sp. SIOASIH]NEO38100.1 hypothetical protein [Moorena sp. SIOASIH]
MAKRPRYANNLQPDNLGLWPRYANNYSLLTHRIIANIKHNHKFSIRHQPFQSL